MVITDKEAGYGHSLIAVFHDLSIRVPESAEVPTNALLPKEWAIFSKWRIDPTEGGKKIKLICEAFWPNGDPLFRSELPAAQIIKNQTTFIIRNLGFPMGQNGIIRIVLSVFVEDELAHDPVELEINFRLEKDLPA
jgi:hypothetical protein